MNAKLIGIVCIFLSNTALSLPPDPNKTLLPNQFPVYTNGKIAINHPMPGFTKKLIPTNNAYTGNPGCYIACYSHIATQAIYAVGTNIYMIGQVRVPGTYVNRSCVPRNYQGQDISGLSQFKELCNTRIKACQDCWAGGDTGGWFGIQVPVAP